MPRYDFTDSPLPEEFQWINSPPRYTLGQGLHLTTAPDTDFWQRTHYGFRRDNGHCLLINASGDFSLETRVKFRPTAQYDQCGLFVRVDPENWIKASTEFENEKLSRLGSVVTNLGYSDWATQDITGECNAMAYRIQRHGLDFLVESREHGGDWKQMRIAHLHCGADSLDIGIYACSPVGQGFTCTFDYIGIAESRWHTHA